MSWQDITDGANWTPIVAALSAPSGLQFFDATGARDAWDVTDLTTDGPFFEFVGGKWTPTDLRGTQPTTGFIPCLQYIGPALSSINGLRITAKNRDTLPAVELILHRHHYCSTGAQISSAVPIAVGTEFVFEITGALDVVDYIGFSDVSNYETLLNHLYCLVAEVDDDYVLLANNPHLFDITKIEVDAIVAGVFWVDGVNAAVLPALAKEFSEAIDPGSPGSEGQPYSHSCPPPLPPQNPGSSGGGPPSSGGPPNAEPNLFDPPSGCAGDPRNGCG